MTDNNRLMENKLVAEFMGWKIQEDETGELAVYFLTKGAGWVYLKPLYECDYDSNWQNLMPVVEKIERLGFDVFICQKECTIHPDDLMSDTESIHSESDTKLSAVYTSCVKFIKYYQNLK